MRRAEVMWFVNRDAWNDGVRPKPPKEPWYVNGPRSGRYRATGAISEDVADPYEPEFHYCDVVAVRFRSDGVKYLRPRTREWEESFQ